MRLLLSLFTITLSNLLFSQTKKVVFDPFANSQKKIYITGRVKNYIPDNDNRFISFRSYDISGRSKDSAVFISESGSFRTVISQPFEGDIAMMFAEQFITLYAVPGERMSLEIDAAKIKTETDKSKAIIIAGNSAPVSKLIMKFKPPRLDSVPADENWNDSTLTDQAIAKARIKRMNSDIDILNRWMNKNAVTNKTFANWAKNNIIYDAGFEIALSLYSGGRRKADDQQLFEMLKDIPLNNAAAVHNSAYYRYLDITGGALQIIVNINPQYDSVRKQMGKNSVPIYLKKMDQYSSGFVRQMMYYRTFNSNAPEKTAMYADNFDSVIKLPYIQQQVLQIRNSKPFQPFNIVERLKEYPADDSIKRRLISMFEANKKTLFVDFWGDWCMPCMQEMPQFSKLVDTFKNSELQFLFLAVETSEEKSAAVKKKFKIDAPFIVLNDNETRILNNILQFHSYPSHFIIGPGGIVKENFGMKVKSGNELSKEAFDKMKKYSALWY